MVPLFAHCEGGRARARSLRLPEGSRSPSRRLGGMGRDSASTTRRPAPPIDLVDYITGNNLTMSSLKGKKVLIAFFRCACQRLTATRSPMPLAKRW